MSAISLEFVTMVSVSMLMAASSVSVTPGMSWSSVVNIVKISTNAPATRVWEDSAPTLMEDTSVSVLQACLLVRMVEHVQTGEC